jgi:hypothetical protein
MHLYNIYKSPTGAIEAVKHGWSWPGFFLNWIWAIVKGLNAIAAAYLVACGIVLAAYYFGVLSAESKTANALVTLGGLCFWTWLGARGNQLRETSLRKRGYEFVKAVNAETSENAVAIFAKESHSVGNAS